MTVAFRSRGRTRPTVDTADLGDQGIHRDPTAHDPISSGGFTQKLVHRASALLSGGTSTRRSFLTRTAVLGSALAVGPIDFILKPGTAYGYVCGACSEGWTAFCCTINSGKNSCPPGSFIAGWWKADNAAYCCGAARYIIDCNATCPTQCSCRCTGASCDNRKTCCNQFRYGQCHQEIACYGPVVCRVATCTVPWKYDPSCTTSSATDNRTVNHGAPCLTTDCGTPIAQKYSELGGATGALGAALGAEEAMGDGRGRRQRFKNGNIYWTQTTGAHDVRGSLLREYGEQGGAFGGLKYPTSDTRMTTDKTRRYNNFENGRIYSTVSGGITLAILNPFFSKHESLRGSGGVLGYPTAEVKSSVDNASTYVSFANGRIYAWGSRVVEIHGSVFRLHEALGGVTGQLKRPVIDLAPVGDGRGTTQWFEGGMTWTTSTTLTQALWGDVLDRYVENGTATGYLKYPKGSLRNVGDARGTFAVFENGHIYASPTTEGHQVHGAVLTYYLAHGGPTGSLGYPTTELDPSGSPGGRFQTFENGRISYANGTVTLV